MKSAAVIFCTLGFGQALTQDAASSTKQLRGLASGREAETAPAFRRMDDDEMEAEEGDEFEGDMLLTSDQRFALGLDGDDSEMMDVQIDVHRKWPMKNGVVEVPYVHVSQLTKSSQDKWNRAMAEIASKTCVRFVPRKSEGRYVRVHASEVCSSSVGVVTVNNLRIGDNCAYGSYIHEMMHTLGMYHEQSRPDRDQYVRIDLSNVRDGMEHNFKLCSDCHTMDVPYEYESVMHYGAHAFGKDRSKKTIFTTTGASIGQRSKMTDLDAESVNLMYKCPARGSAWNEGWGTPPQQWIGGGYDTKEECLAVCKKYAQAKACAWKHWGDCYWFPDTGFKKSNTNYRGQYDRHYHILLKGGNKSIYEFTTGHCSAGFEHITNHEQCAEAALATGKAKDGFEPDDVKRNKGWAKSCRHHTGHGRVLIDINDRTERCNLNGYNGCFCKRKNTPQSDVCTNTSQGFDEKGVKCQWPQSWLVNCDDWAYNCAPNVDPNMPRCCQKSCGRSCPASENKYIVTVGNSGHNTKTVDYDVESCPSVVDASNWLDGYTYPDKFSVVVSAGKITVKRLDANHGWGMHLKFKCKAARSNYDHKYKGCVNGHNLVKYTGKSVNECAELCDARSDCKAFEYGMNYGGNGSYRAKDCQLQSSSNSGNCNGGYHNLDLYTKKGRRRAEVTEAAELSLGDIPSTPAPATEPVPTPAPESESAEVSSTEESMEDFDENTIEA